MTPSTRLTVRKSFLKESYGRRLHVVNLPGPLGVDNRHGQHDTVFTPTPGEPLQGDPGGYALYPEADWRQQMVPGIRELRYMAITLPGAMGLFRHMKEALHHVEGKSLVLTRVVHQDLTDFWWLVENLSKLPTRLYELVPLKPTLNSYHYASGYMCGGAVLPGPMAVPRTPQPQPSAAATSPEPAGAHPIV